MIADLARELRLEPGQVERTLALHDGGATVPFIARYRKEATGGLDEVQIQRVLDRAAERRELEERRKAVIRSIEEQGKMTPELAAAIHAARSKVELEDLYLPYRPKRRTRASIARERGLEPLADLVWQAAPGDPMSIAQKFVDAGKGVPDVDSALAGARDICAERVSEDAALRAMARAIAQPSALLRSLARKKDRVGSKYDGYHDHDEPLQTAPSHRVLAILRGEAEDELRVRIELPDEQIVRALLARVVRNARSPLAVELRTAVEDGWTRLLGPSLVTELRSAAKDRADADAIEVFGKNLRHLLLAPAAGGRRVVALDPGLRTGVKLAAIDATGKVVATATLYTERSPEERARAGETLRSILEKHRPDLIAVGSGTGGREAEAFVRDALEAWATKVPVVSVSEQGASVYSASEIAREELGDLDVSLRGAASIGRRLQDPLAELVKIDPKSIGVGQYQHDVDQAYLKRKLDEVTCSCVNAVGVDVNTASRSLLAYVSGLGPALAKKIVAHRDRHGPYRNRHALLDVSGLGPRAFEQAAGFLRVRGGHPLDDSAVHPERYDLVARMAKDLAVPLSDLVGAGDLVRRIDWRRYQGSDLGEPTLRDILGELAKPGRDPRGDFSAPSFREDLRDLEDVKEGMVLEGVVTNVTAFGAFVDVGIHHDGLVHVSQLAARFVKDPGEVVKVGDRIKVKVLGVDLARRRMSLSVRALLAS